MANPANYPLQIIVGDTKNVAVTFQDGAGSPINITGRTYSAQVRATVDSAAALANFTCSIANAAGGQVVCTLAATTTSSLSEGDGIWSLRETNGTVITTLLEGPVRIVQSPTR